MNWYKRAQRKNRLAELLKGFSMGTIIGLIGWLGLTSMADLQNEYVQNPQAVEQKIVQYQNTQPQETPVIQEPIQEPVQQTVQESGTVSQEDLETHFKDEYEVILNAAKRNNLDPEDYDLLFSIRKAENGSKGREFGIIHPKCDAEMKRRPNDTLDIQAGWAAATIVKNRARWEKAGKPGDFITFLGNRYAPKGVANDPTNLNKHWIKNVTDWEEKI
jgi:hypothetical protein